MNKHLNVFKTYTKKERKDQLENDLSRAFAICMQEDPQFFFSVLRNLLKDSEDREVFDYLDSDSKIEVDIQLSVSEIARKGFDKLYAVSLSAHEMNMKEFFQADNRKEYDPVCDAILSIENNNGQSSVFIFEVKRGAENCIQQLNNQAYNILRYLKEGIEDVDPEKMLRNNTIPLDLNWKKLMEIAVRILDRERAVNKENRFLADFVEYVNDHNYTWLPQKPISALNSSQIHKIRHRVNTAIKKYCEEKSINPVITSDRISVPLSKLWVKEMLFIVRNKHNKDDETELVIAMYPGNSKAQGIPIFSKNKKFKTSVLLNNNKRPIGIAKLVKFAGHSGRHITGIWFEESALNKNGDFFNSENFRNYCGRKKRESWGKLEDFFDYYFKKEFNWREKCEWNKKIIASNRTQTDVSFGYEITLVIPFEDLKKLDTDKDSLTGLFRLIEDVKSEFANLLE